MDVLLQDASPLNSIRSILDYIFNFVVFLGNFDTLSLVCVFTWLDDPDVLGCHLSVIVLLLFLLAFGLLDYFGCLDDGFLKLRRSVAVINSLSDFTLILGL